MAQSPRLLGRPLRGEGLWRYRTGDFRVLCQIHDDVMVVLVADVGHRREIYREERGLVRETVRRSMGDPEPTGDPFRDWIGGSDADALRVDEVVYGP